MKRLRTEEGGESDVLRIQQPTCTPNFGVALAERRLSRGLPRTVAAPPAAPPLRGRALMPTLGSETTGSDGKAPYGVWPTDGAGPCGWLKGG